MKILVFSPFYPPHTGGLETHCEEFNQKMVKKGFSVVVYTPNIPIQANWDEHQNGIRIIRFPAFEVVANFPVPRFWSPSFWKTLDIIWKMSFDIVISRTRFFITSLIALLYAKRKKVYWVHIEHGSDYVKLASPLKSMVAKIYDLTFGKMVFRTSDINVSISNAVRTFVARFDKRVSPIIYRGIEFSFIDEIDADKTIRDKYEGKIIICTVARLYKWKGIELSIEAIGLLPDEIKKKIIFLVVGDGEDFVRLKQLAGKLPVEMVGKKTRGEVVAILKSSDIYLHSSLPGGGLSTSLLEAMYCQCAIIASPNEGANEIINDDNGVLLKEVSSKEISSAIIDLINNVNKEKSISEQAKKDVSHKFNWEKAIKSYEEIFYAK